MPKHELSPLPAAVGGQVGVGHDEHAGQRDGVRKGEEEAGGQDPGHLQGGHHVPRTVGQQAGDVLRQLSQAQLHKGVPCLLVHGHIRLAVEPAQGIIF